MRSAEKIPLRKQNPNSGYALGSLFVLRTWRLWRCRRRRRRAAPPSGGKGASARAPAPAPPTSPGSRGSRELQTVRTLSKMSSETSAAAADTPRAAEVAAVSWARSIDVTVVLISRLSELVGELGPAAEWRAARRGAGRHGLRTGGESRCLGLGVSTSGPGCRFTIVANWGQKCKTNASIVMLPARGFQKDTIDSLRNAYTYRRR